MQSEDFRYILELQTFVNKENVPFERRYFHGLHETLISLLQIPADRYSTDNNSPQEKEISTVRVLEQTGGVERQIASTFELSISDSLPDGPSAGIYLHHNDHQGNEYPIGALEDKIATSFYKLRNYDHDLPMVQLARYVYDDTLKLIADPALKDLVADIKKKAAAPWEYSLKVADEHQSIGAHYFYHPSMVGAFDQLISLPYFTPGPEGNGSQLPPDPLTVTISDRTVDPMIAVKEYSHYQEGRGAIPGPFLVLEVGGGMGRLEAMADVNLSGFKEYNHNAYRLLIGEVDPSTRVFSPVAAFDQLQQGNLPSPTLASPASNYTLLLEYRQLHPVNIDQALTAATFTTATFSDLKDAVVAMRKLDLEAFDVASEVKKGRDNYLHEAVIHDTREGHEIARMFSIVRAQPEVPAGIYMKVHPEHISTETLQAFQPYVQHLPGKGPFLFLVRQYPVQHMEQRRRPSGPRHFQGGSTRGL